MKSDSSNNKGILPLVITYLSIYESLSFNCNSFDNFTFYIL